MSDNIFNQDWFRLFNHTWMDEFLKMSQLFKKFGLNSKDVEDAIKSACDFFHIPMPRMIEVGLILTNASPTHPEGALRALFVRHGMYKAIEMRDNSIPLSIKNLLNEFMAYRQENLEQIHHFQRKFYRF